MKLTKKQQEFIKQTHNNVCIDWKEKIKEHFPKLFEDEFKVGDCVRILGSSNGKALAIYNGTQNMTGFNYSGEWSNYIGGAVKMEKAKPEEVESRLIEEAKRRGVWNVPIIQPMNEIPQRESKGKSNEGYVSDSDQLFSQYGIVYWDGKWAEILKTITKEEAEKELNCKII